MNLINYLNGRAKNQVIAVCGVSIGIYCVGSSAGWFSPVLPILKSADTPLISGPITATQVSILGGLSSGFACLSVVLFAALDKCFGLRKTLWICSIPGIISWILVIATNEIEFLYVSRILTGILTGGVFYAMPLYVAEIADDDIRGRLSSIISVLSNLSILIAYIVGSYASYTLAACTAIIGPLAFAFVLFFIPDTPTYLLSKGKTEEAEKSMSFYKNCERNSDRFKVGMEKIRNFIESDKYKEKLQIADFCTPEARFGFFIGISMILLAVLNGSLILTSYASTIFLESGSNLDAMMSSIVVQLLQLVSSFILILLVDGIGRWNLLMISASGAAVGFILMGIFSYLSVQGVDVNTANWVPVFSLSISVFCANIGLVPLSIIILAENFPSKIRSEGCFVCIIFLHFMSAVAATVFPILTDTFELYVSMWIFGGVCTVGLIYAIFILKDTTGKDLLNDG